MKMKMKYIIIPLAVAILPGCVRDKNAPLKPAAFEIDSKVCISAGGVPIRDPRRATMMSDCIFNPCQSRETEK